MNTTIILEYIENIEKKIEEHEDEFEFASNRLATTEMIYEKGVLKGLQMAIEELNKKLDEELKNMAANMEGEKND